MKSAIIAAIVAAISLGIAGVARGDTPPTLTWNKQVGSVWINESWNRVEYNWGPKNEVGCMLMDEAKGGGCAVGGFMVRYDISGGYVRIGVYKQKVVYIEVTSPYFESPSGVGVSSTLPYGKKTVLDGTAFHSHVQPGGGLFWSSWTKFIPWPKKAKDGAHPNGIYKRWVKAVSHQSGTFLWMSKGVIRDIWIVRGDVDLQI